MSLLTLIENDEFLESAFLGNDSLMFFNGSSVYDQDMRMLLDVRLLDRSFGLEIDSQGVWLNEIISEGVWRSRSYVLNGSGFPLIEGSNVPFLCSSLGVWVGGRHVGISKIGRKHFIRVNDSQGNELAVHEGRFSGGIVATKEYIFARKNGTAIYCFDYNLNPVWLVSSDKMVMSDATLRLYIYEDLVILNVGEHVVGERGKFEINAYVLKTGELAWQQIVETSPASSNLIEDKLYVFVGKRFVQIDARTGVVDIDVEHGFPEFSFQTNVYKGAVYPVLQGLLFCDYASQLLQLRSFDGIEILQETKLPETYTVDYRKTPVELDGKVYIKLWHASLALNPMKSAIAVLSLNESADDSPEVKFEKRPEYTVDHRDSGGVVSTFVSLTGDDLELMVRYGAVILKEQAFKTGVTPLVEFETRNKSHGGQLGLTVNCSGLLEKGITFDDCEKRFGSLKQRVEEQFKNSGVRAGDGENPFVVTVTCLK